MSYGDVRRPDAGGAGAQPVPAPEPDYRGAYQAQNGGWGAGGAPASAPAPQSGAVAQPGSGGAVAPYVPAAPPPAPHPLMQHFAGMLSHPDGQAQAVAAGWTPPRTMQEAQGFAQRLAAVPQPPRLPAGLPQQVTAALAPQPSTSAAAPAPPMFGAYPTVR